MSLFDVIKYPISNPPTIEQLKALPDSLFFEFVFRCDWFVSKQSAYTSDYLQYRKGLIIEGLSEGAYPEDILTLRKMIQEYDESI